MELNKLLQKIDWARNTIQEAKPPDGERQKELDLAHKIDITFTSAALEGNTLTLPDTESLLVRGVTTSERPLTHYMESAGHGEAFDFMLEIARSGKLTFWKEMILDLHFLIGYRANRRTAGQYRRSLVPESEEKPVSANGADIAQVVGVFMKTMNEKAETMHPILLALFAHRGVMEIQPFDERNGLLARLFMNLILVGKGYCPISIAPAAQDAYRAYLDSIGRGENPGNEAFFRLVAEAEWAAVRAYCKAIQLRL